MQGRVGKNGVVSRANVAPQILLKRAYEKSAKTDGFRVLVDRLWPRGVSKINLRLDMWAKGAAPSTALRKWFGHDPERWGGIRQALQSRAKRRRSM